MQPDSRESALDERQARAVVLLTQGRTGIETAREVGVDPTTLRRWRRSPSFVAAVSEAQGEAIEAAQVRLGGLLDGALSAIESVLADPAAPHAARLRAAELVLNRVLDAAAKTAEQVPADPADVARALEFIRWSDQQGAA